MLRHVATNATSLNLLILPGVCSRTGPSTKNDGHVSEGQTVAEGVLLNSELIPGSPEATIGQVQTIRCVSRGGSLPVTYTLFHNKSTKGKMTASEERGATFSVTIYDHASLGSYRCKANNSFTGDIYSKEFWFTLLEPTSHWLLLWMRLLIFLNLLVLTLVIMVALIRTGVWKP
ncbi:uncharacterized protein LOC143936215 [Lithobates pipiens]